ncbi:DNA replication and checkpoint protein-domain-containing protein [Irpex lacteus]|nr:DNA replication and checkpoint protein-domain-containing protein [Irpex lacteus]
MDVSELRAEIKTWEREFRSSHGRDPSIQEIKDRPDIAEKYKLYKKLSKQASTASTSAKSFPDDRRRASPRSSHRPSTSSLLLSTSKHRAVKTEAPAITSNPFSPVKNKGKGRHNDNDNDDHPADSGLDTLPLLLSSNSRTKTNPFTTPSKPRPRASSFRKIPPPVLEEDPFPLIDSHTIASSSKPRPPQQSQVSHPTIEKPHNADDPPSHSGPPTAKLVEDAVTRARKRLRGEHVSPSPVKEKRVRTDIERVNSFSRGSLLDALQAAKEEDSDDEPVRRGSDEEFIGETPVKPRQGGKAFVKLFEEAVPSSSFPQTRPKSSKQAMRTKSAGASLFAFGFGSQSNGKQRASSPEDEMEVDQHESSSLVQTRKLRAPVFAATKPVKSGKSNKPLAKVVASGQNEPFDDNSSTTSVSARVSRLAIKKRPLAGDDDEDEDEGADSGTEVPPPSRLPTSSPPPLLPPSPPPASANGSRYDRSKAGGSKGIPRKKTKLLDQLMAANDVDEGMPDEESEGESDEVKVKEIPWSWSAHLRQPKAEGVPESDDDTLPDSEPELDVTKYRPAPLSSTVDSEAEKFEVNLPEHLRHVLAISPPKPKAVPDDEERLARGVIYGRREGHYDPGRGGEIWGVGEAEEEDGEEEFDLGSGDRKGSRGKEGEEDDEWEGEPVPWEVGEL